VRRCSAAGGPRGSPEESENQARVCAEDRVGIHVRQIVGQVGGQRESGTQDEGADQAGPEIEQVDQPGIPEGFQIDEACVRIAK
jgi:hypothetical protein